MWFDDFGKSSHKFLRPTQQCSFLFEALQDELRPVVQAPINAGKGDVDCATPTSELDAVELPRSDLAPEGRSRTAQQIDCFRLIYQLHPFCLDSSHYSSPVLGCSLSTEGNCLSE